MELAALVFFFAIAALLMIRLWFTGAPRYQRASGRQIAQATDQSHAWIKDYPSSADPRPAEEREEPPPPYEGARLSVQKSDGPADGIRIREGAQIITHRAQLKTRDRSLEVRLWMQVAVTIIILLAALLLIFLRKDAEEQKWAFGTVGLILGFWLK